MKIRLHIDRLILHGIPLTGAGGLGLRAAVESELAVQLIHGGVRRELKGAVLPSVQVAKAVEATPGRPRDLGRALARAVYSGIGEGEPRPGVNSISHRTRGAGL